MLFLKPDVTKKNREFLFLEGFVWSHHSITGLISRRQFVPKCQFLASRPLGCSSFQNILTNPIISQINTLLLPYFISYYSSALISSTTMTPKCTLRSVLLFSFLAELDARASRSHIVKKIWLSIHPRKFGSHLNVRPYTLWWWWWGSGGIKY